MSDPDTAVAEVALRNCFCATELESVERALAGRTGVVGVHVDRTRSVAHLRYLPSHTSAEAVRRQVDARGYRCECIECPDSCCQPGHPCLDWQDARTSRDRHAGQETGHAGSHGQASRSAADTRPAPEHGPHEVPAGHETHKIPVGHDAHAGHGSNMVNDMLRRFVRLGRARRS